MEVKVLEEVSKNKDINGILYGSVHIYEIKIDIKNSRIWINVYIYIHIYYIQLCGYIKNGKQKGVPASLTPHDITSDIQMEFAMYMYVHV